MSLPRSWYQFPVPTAYWRTLLYLLSVLSAVLVMLTLYFAGVLQFELPGRVFWLLLPLQAVLAGVVALVCTKRSELPVTHYLAIMLLAAFLLAWFLHDTGGHTNPLVSLLLLPVAMTAGTMPWQATALLAAVVIFAYGLLTRTFVPLHHPLPGHAIDLTQLHLLGMWLTFILSCVLLVVLVAPLASAVRRQQQVIALQREQMARDEQLVALATFAAGAAHQLATPLATMTILADELADTAPDDERGQDLRQIATQAKACKDVLKTMMARAELLRGESLQDNSAPGQAHGRVRIADWCQQLALDFNLLWPARTLVRQLPEQADVTVRHDAMLDQAMLNLLDNAARASEGDLLLRVIPEGAMVSLQVVDRGAGLPEGMRLGQPFVSGREGGNGLGLFLSNAAIERHGGTLRLYRADEGTIAEVKLPVFSPVEDGND